MSAYEYQPVRYGNRTYGHRMFVNQSRRFLYRRSSSCSVISMTNEALCSSAPSVVNLFSGQGRETGEAIPGQR